MARETVRTHVVIPRELVDAVDRVVGQRRRNDFVVETLREKLAHDRLGRALRETAGSLNLADHPEWQTAEAVSAWVRELRAQDREGVEHTLPRRESVWPATSLIPIAVSTSCTISPVQSRSSRTCTLEETRSARVIS